MTQTQTTTPPESKWIEACGEEAADAFRPLANRHIGPANNRRTKKALDAAEWVKANAAEILHRWNCHDDLVEAMKALFENCAMVHNQWGDGCNQKEADAAIERAKAARANAERRNQ